MTAVSEPTSGARKRAASRTCWALTARRTTSTGGSSFGSPITLGCATAKSPKALLTCRPCVRTGERFASRDKNHIVTGFRKAAAKVAADGPHTDNCNTHGLVLFTVSRQRDARECKGAPSPRQPAASLSSAVRRPGRSVLLDHRFDAENSASLVRKKQDDRASAGMHDTSSLTVS